MQQWEYMWIYVTHEQGRHVYVANGQRLEAQTNVEALNAVGKDGWELVSAVIIPNPNYSVQLFPQFCLKRRISE